MTRRFKAHGDGVRMQLESFEVALLRELQEGLEASLRGGDPQDPVLRRLFPSAVAGDRDADDELRGMIHDDLFRQRLDGLERLLELLDRGTTRGRTLRVDLVDEEPLVVLGVLNDLRLAIGARLDLDALDRERLEPEDPEAYRVAVMDHFAWLQEQLLAVVDPSSTTVYEEGDP